MMGSHGKYSRKRKLMRQFSQEDQPQQEPKKDDRQAEHTVSYVSGFSSDILVDSVAPNRHSYSQEPVMIMQLKQCDSVGEEAEEGPPVNEQP